jgi:hypothetical protein
MMSLRIGYVHSGMWLRLLVVTMSWRRASSCQHFSRELRSLRSAVFLLTHTPTHSLSDHVFDAARSNARRTEAASFGRSHSSGSGSGSGTGRKDFIRYYPIYTVPPFRPYIPTPAPYVPKFTHYDYETTSSVSAWAVIRIILIIAAFFLGLMRCQYHRQHGQERERAARETNRAVFAAIVASPSKAHTTAPTTRMN